MLPVAAKQEEHMLRILIVDDEPIFRMGLRAGISWSEYGCEIIGEASNGREALSIIQAQNPDIIFLDIKMPGMDGIELLKNCQPHSGQCFIVLSCFNEYDYVREAMKLGAMDYLFKPLMEKEDIEKVLLEAEEKLGYSMQADQARQHEKEVQNALQLILENKDMSGPERFRMLEPEISSFPFFPLHISLKSRELDSEKASAILDSCRALISGFFSAFQCFFLRKDRSLLCLLFSKLPHPEPVGTHQLRLLYGKLQNITENCTWMGADCLHYALSELPQSLRHACLASEANYFQPLNGSLPLLMIFDSRMEKNYEFAEIYQPEIGAIKEAVLQYDIDIISTLIHQIAQNIRAQEFFNREDFCHLLTSIITDSMRIYRNRIILEQLLLSNYHLISDIYHQPSMDEAVSLFLQILMTLFAHLNGNTGSFHARLLQETLDYIGQHYSEKLSLEMMAERAHLSINYFCKLFKDQTGETFVNYLNKTRIHAAVWLLSTTSMKTYEIADAVGFSDYHHFTKTFKKITGLTPSAVRDQPHDAPYPSLLSDKG